MTTWSRRCFIVRHALVEALNFGARRPGLRSAFHPRGELLRVPERRRRLGTLWERQRHEIVRSRRPAHTHGMLPTQGPIAPTRVASEPLARVGSVLAAPRRRDATISLLLRYARVLND